MGMSAEVHDGETAQDHRELRTAAPALDGRRVSEGATSHRLTRRREMRRALTFKLELNVKVLQHQISFAAYGHAGQR